PEKFFEPTTSDSCAGTAVANIATASAATASVKATRLVERWSFPVRFMGRPLVVAPSPATGGAEEQTVPAGQVLGTPSGRITAPRAPARPGGSAGAAPPAPTRGRGGDAPGSRRRARGGPGRGRARPPAARRGSRRRRPAHRP